MGPEFGANQFWFRKGDQNSNMGKKAVKSEEKEGKEQAKTKVAAVRVVVSNRARADERYLAPSSCFHHPVTAQEPLFSAETLSTQLANTQLAF